VAPARDPGYTGRLFAERAGMIERESKHVFFEKKKQKTFIRLASAFPDGLSLKGQKFFGSFFQKRTASFLKGFGA
jgi:hypothetical protein